MFTTYCLLLQFRVTSLYVCDGSVRSYPRQTNPKEASEQTSAVKTSVKEEESIKSVKFVKMLLKSSSCSSDVDVMLSPVNVLFSEINRKVSRSPVRVDLTQLLPRVDLILSEIRSLVAVSQCGDVHVDDDDHGSDDDGSLLWDNYNYHNKYYNIYYGDSEVGDVSAKNVDVGDTSAKDVEFRGAKEDDEDVAVHDSNDEDDDHENEDDVIHYDVVHDPIDEHDKEDDDEEYDYNADKEDVPMMPSPLSTTQAKYLLIFISRIALDRIFSKAMRRMKKKRHKKSK